MREIKFRVWNSKKHNMSYFDLGKNKPIEDVVFGLMLASQEGNGILMQFTGLHDKNGKEIYEGDILKTNTYQEKYQNFSVIFSGGRFHLNITDKYILNRRRTNSFSQCDTLIGNIYENADLLRSE